jgi:hypothetical protein
MTTYILEEPTASIFSYTEDQGTVFLLTLVIICQTRLDGWNSIPARGKIFLFSTAYRLAFGPTQPPIQCVLWGKAARV